MNLHLRPPFTPHVLYVRPPAGDTLEVDLDPIMQPKLAVQYAYQLARFLTKPADTVGEDWQEFAREDLDACDANPLDCTVEVFRRVPPGYPGAVNGFALLLEVPVAPGIPSINPDALRTWPVI